jgi:hypothetical protein
MGPKLRYPPVHLGLCPHIAPCDMGPCSAYTIADTAAPTYALCIFFMCGVACCYCTQAANGVNVSQPVIDMMQRLTFLNACTFSFATHANPLTQHMYECTTCNQTVCVICMVRSRARYDKTLTSHLWFGFVLLARTTRIVAHTHIS